MSRRRSGVDSPLCRHRFTSLRRHRFVFANLAYVCVCVCVAARIDVSVKLDLDMGTRVCMFAFRIFRNIVTIVLGCVCVAMFADRCVRVCACVCVCVDVHFYVYMPAPLSVLMCP